MRQISQLQLALACVALGGMLIAGIACGSSGGKKEATPTGTPFYAATDVLPTSGPDSLEPTVENLPSPVLTGEPTVTASGLQIYDVKVGTGVEAQENSIVYVNYTDWVKGGNQVDKTHAGPVRMRLTKGQIIDGLAEGLTGMKVGGRRILIIPPDLAYGSTGSGNVIPPGATLIFDIEMTTQPTPEP